MNQSVGLRLKAARNAAGLTQEQLAEQVDRTKEAISNIERGHNLPTIETLHRMCEVLNIPIRYIFGDAGGSSRRIECIAKIELILADISDDELATVADVVTVLAVSYANKK
ncbi:helix-turn-helix domain-containing protein [Methylobacterium sp. E-041]|uniref:helix-turn-helix transcriptional regulator n=1 Tax=Methylobacterium sp. E-041 TaxID=2836573 RepID=UPI001FB9F770|nr:helix-turn-helix transcriptional regulator [Methylobacterium sp. E-041]MCJ2105917.1 helix-turn-helix domain-containing protein [Methylobacterium sp. E-041]